MSPARPQPDTTAAARSERGRARIADVCLGRDNNYDLLRFLAASLVMVSHAYPLTLGDAVGEAREPLERLTHDQQSLGGLGVAVFFVISGFLVTQSFDRRKHVGRFFKARLLRLLPALVTVVALCAFVLGPLVTVLPRLDYFADPRTYVYLANVFMIPYVASLPGVFADNPYPGTVNGSLWTLRYEILCYAFVALAGVAGVLAARRRWLVAGCFAVALGVSALPAGAVPGFAVRGATLFALFSAGMLLFLGRRRVPLDWRVAVGALAVCVVAARLGGYDVVFPVCGAYLILWIAYNRSFRAWRFGRHGDFSYGMYLWAFPVQQLVVMWLGSGIAIWQNLALSYPLTLVCAVLSWHLVEARFLRLKDRPLLRRRVATHRADPLAAPNGSRSKTHV